MVLQLVSLHGAEIGAHRTAEDDRAVRVHLQDVLVDVVAVGAKEHLVTALVRTRPGLGRSAGAFSLASWSSLALEVVGGRAFGLFAVRLVKVRDIGAVSGAGRVAYRRVVEGDQACGLLRDCRG